MATYLVTGATRGIGRAVAAALAARGERLLLVVRDDDGTARVRELFPAAAPVVMDLARPDTIVSAVAEVEREGALDGGLAGLVHSAGVVELGTVERTVLATWVDTLTVNLVAPAELTRALLPAVRAAAGQVVFINSGQGMRASGGWSAYAASKFGLRALADALRIEEAPRGVRVTTVYPGRTATDMQRQVRAAEGGTYSAADYLRPETVADAVLAALDTDPGATLTEVVVRPSDQDSATGSAPPR